MSAIIGYKLLLEFPKENEIKAKFKKSSPLGKNYVDEYELKIQNAVIHFFAEKTLKPTCVQECVRLITLGQNATQKMELAQERLAFIEKALTVTICNSGKFVVEPLSKL